MAYPRKRPECRTCGAPMAGHKRINGRSVCPDIVLNSPALCSESLKDEDEDLSSPWQGPGQVWRNEYFRETHQEDAVAFARRSPDSPFSWTPTEPDDTVKREFAPRSTGFPDRELTAHHSSQSLPRRSSSMMSTTSSQLKHTFYSVLGRHPSAVTVVEVSTEELSTVTRVARMSGFHTGVTRWPSTEVKNEGGSHRTRQRAVIIGKDPEVVERWLERDEREELARLDRQERDELARSETEATLAPFIAPTTNIKVATPGSGPTSLQIIYLGLVSATGSGLVLIMLLWGLKNLDVGV